MDKIKQLTMDEGMMEDYPTIKRITKSMKGEDVPWMTCARCGSRVGSHTFRESWKHGLITKKEYIKFYEDETERLKAVKNAK